MQKHYRLSRCYKETGNTSSLTELNRKQPCTTMDLYTDWPRPGTWLKLFMVKIIFSVPNYWIRPWNTIQIITTHTKCWEMLIPALNNTTMPLLLIKEAMRDKTNQYRWWDWARVLLQPAYMNAEAVPYYYKNHGLKTSYETGFILQMPIWTAVITPMHYRPTNRHYY